MGKQKKATPETYQVRIADNALRNIDEITGYISFINLEPHNAIKVGDEIISTIKRIGQHPYAFRECDELATKAKMYRRAICLSWLIVYKIFDSEVIILGVIHSFRKPSGIKALRKIK